MTVLAAGSKIQRDIHISGVEKAVTVEITSMGMSFWVKGHRKKVNLSWYAAASAGSTPVDVPSFLMSKPIELLQYQAKEKTTK
jgi:hypothetical protein